MDNKPDNRKNGNQNPDNNGPKNRQPIFAFLMSEFLYEYAQRRRF